MTGAILIEQIPTAAALYTAKKLIPAASTSAAPNLRLNNKVSLIRADITKLKVDAIVNAANNGLLGGGGVDGAIHRAAGRELVKECATLDGCDTGSAKITKAYNLPSKHVIHAVGPVYDETKAEGRHTSLLQGCYQRSLELAVENNLKSIAFSALSTGVYGYPSNEAAETALGVVRKFLEGIDGEKLERVIFCNFTEKDEVAYEKFTPKFFPPTESLEGDGKEKVSETPA